MPFTMYEAKDLELLLGFVGTGDITAGSNALFVGFSPLPWQLSGTPLSAADIGRTIAVIGAGPNAPVVPTFGPPGKMLVTTIATFVDGAHCTLTASASNTSISGAANTILYRPVKFKEGSLSNEDNISTPGRGTLSFTIISKTGMQVCEGMPVLLRHPVLGDLFGGTVDSVRITNEAGAEDGIWIECQCVTYASILDRRVVNPYINNGGSFSGNAGDAVVDLIYNYVDSEGLSTAVVAGPTILLPTEALNTAAQTMDNIVRAASTSILGYIWWIDPWRVVHLAAATALAAPWNIADDDGTDASVLSLVDYERSRDKLANYVFDTESSVLGDELTETFKGDPANTSYSLKNAVGTPSTVKVNGVLESVGYSGQAGVKWWWSAGSNTIVEAPLTETFHGNSSTRTFDCTRRVGYLAPATTLPLVNVDIKVNGVSKTVHYAVTAGAQWYVAIPSFPKRVGQDPSETILTAGDTLTVHYQPTLETTDTLEIKYRPKLERSYFKTNNASIIARSAIESGTGIFGLATRGDNPVAIGDVDAQVQEKADSLSSPPIVFGYSTLRSGLKISQVQHIKWTARAVEGDFLIDRVSLSTEKGWLKWTIHAVNGSVIGDWKAEFGRFQNQPSGLGGTTVPAPSTGTAGPTDPPDGLTYSLGLTEYGVLRINDIAVVTPNQIQGIDWYVGYVDELTADPNSGLWATDDAGVDGSTDPVTFTVTPNVANTTGENFAQDDFVIWNEAGKYEVGQLTTKVGNTWTVTRLGHLGSTIVAHTAGTKIFRVLVVRFPQLAPAGSDLATGVPTQFDIDVPNACVVAVVGEPYNAAGVGTFATVNAALATVPGLRTLSGITYVMQLPGVLAASPGNNAVISQRIDYAGAIRVLAAEVATAPTGAAIIVIPRYSRDGGTTWNGLSTGESITATKKTSYDGLTPAPSDARAPYGLNWPFTVIKPGDLLNFSIQQVGSTIAGADLNVQVGM